MDEIIVKGRMYVKERKKYEIESNIYIYLKRKGGKTNESIQTQAGWLMLAAMGYSNEGELHKSMKKKLHFHGYIFIGIFIY